MDTERAAFNGLWREPANFEGVELLARAAGLDPAEVAKQWQGYCCASSQVLDTHGEGGRKSTLRHRGLLNDAVRALLDGHWALQGVGRRRIERLSASLQLAHWLAREQLLAGGVLDSPSACEDFLLQHLSGERREIFCCLFLDSKNRLLSVENLFHGTIDSAAVYPREIVTRCLLLGASGLICAHNHPSGSVEPSQADLRITERISNAVALLDIRLLDHLIVGRGCVYSMALAGAAGFEG